MINVPNTSMLIVCRHDGDTIELYRHPTHGFQMFPVGESDAAMNHCKGANMKLSAPAFLSKKAAQEHNKAPGEQNRWMVKEFNLIDIGLRMNDAGPKEVK